ncbi:MAG: D-alanyl-D-alanine carboxypeptidase [Bacilli bacterium]|nr:D-alanyl-D-alanine carboxypeptidase [Bacilli bacterium]
MKKILLFLFLLFVFISNCYASTSSAYEYVLMDAVTGRVLSGKNYNTSALIASITKIMTCVLAIESNKLDNIVVVDDTVLKAYGSGIYITVGEELTLRDLLYGLMLRSGNDAALMVAKYVGGDIDNFVSMMNNKANDIGMKNTIFINPSGLDDDGGNYSSAYDMAILTRYAMKYLEYREIVSTKKYTLKTNKNTYIWKNKNKLLSEDYITGGKTGYTDKARRTLVSTGSKDNMDLIVVTIRDSDDWNTHKSLYNMAFKKYKAYKFLDKNNFNITGNNFYKGSFYIKNDVYIPVLEDELSNISGKVILDIIDNYKTGDRVGYYEISLDKNILYKEDIYIKKSGKKSKSSWFRELFS